MKKKNMFMAGILALALVFTLVLTGCPEDEEGEYPIVISNDYVGTWMEDHSNPYVLEISSTELTFKMNPTSDRWYTIEYTEDWIPLTNGTTPYVNGYKIIGTVTEKGAGTALKVWKIDGTTKNDSIDATVGAEVATYYYISNDKATMVGGDPTGSEDSPIYLKKAAWDTKHNPQ